MREKKQRHTQGYATWQVFLKCATGRGGIHKKLRGGDVVRGVDKKGNTNGMEPRWSVHSGIIPKKKNFVYVYIYKEKMKKEII